MRITSPAFSSGKMIPRKYSCQGESINPDLHIEEIPKEAKALALIMEDPDAPHGTFVHWVVFNIPVNSNIAENSSPGTEGMNSGGKIGYYPPCPPSGEHRYFFKVYALDAKLSLKQGATKEDLLKAMQGHILAEAQLMGTYRKA